uniref:Uncharacterized protein n=1 Tax=Arundo donax TaxID=35708 RepID=A0A0A9FR61_ARUDO
MESRSPREASKNTDNTTHACTATPQEQGLSEGTTRYARISDDHGEVGEREPAVAAG